MTARNLIACLAVVFLLGGAGCKSYDLSGIFELEGDPRNRERVVSTSLDVVVQGAQTALSQLGFMANISRKGDVVRIHSRTTRDTEFTLILTRLRGTEHEQTHVQIDWEGHADEPMACQIMGQLELLEQARAQK